MTDKKYDIAFISDIHLSSKKCKVKDICSFFSDYKYETLYILGDYIDLWKLKIYEAWPDDHTNVLIETVQQLHQGVDIQYIIGNHDEWFEEFKGTFGNLCLMRDTEIEINGKRLLVIHGDKYDIAIKWFKTIAVFGTGIVDFFTKAINRMRKEPFSLSEHLDDRSGMMEMFDKALLKAVKKKGFDGVIFGHTHRPHLTIKEGLIYANTGDFVSNSSFILKDGNELQLMQYRNGAAKVVRTLDV